MKLKGYIEVTVIVAGLEATSMTQMICVDNIDVVMDASAMSAGDRERMAIEPQAQTLLVCRSLSDTPCELEDTYEQVIALMKEATE